MEKIMRKLQAEPVRARLYAIGVALVAVLVGYGYVAGEQAPLWLGLGAAVLGVPAVERTRANVVPVVKGTRRRRR